MKISLSAAALLFLCTSLMQAQNVMDDSCRHLNVEEFYIELNLDINPVLIDIRTFDEFSKYRIRGAILAESKADLISITDSLIRDRQLFLYCEDDHRSPVACDILIEKGFTKVYNLKGGLREWFLLKYELDKEKIKTKHRGF